MSKFYNKTRVSDSIPRKLRSEGKWYLIPVYYVLILSHLAHEAVHHSGSYRFADHVYAGKPKGKYFVGQVLDAIFLNLPSASAFRYRYERVKHELATHIKKSEGFETKILYVPSGLAREYFEIDQCIQTHTSDPKKVRMCGLDLDDSLVETLSQRAEKSQSRMEFKSGDAMLHTHYNEDHDMIISTGFIDFLNDEEADQFFRLVYTGLKLGGKFITSGMQPHTLSDFLMRQFAELHTVYRSKNELRTLVLNAGFASVEQTQDRHGLQTVIVATK